jgi:hypothetical protein
VLGNLAGTPDVLDSPALDLAAWDARMFLRSR